ncbi:MAG: 2-oxoglutarate/2-oxoacid ferredoxin oxidoreductase subunit alpha [Solirubrobacterales bacterium]|nr:2-oxoglutarate/2-oxoacid ferredoxin oxidoreductase subunit alpha [Solirubrobacterales bacterium]
MTTTSKKPETVIVRFAGDSGDGMQLVGDRFTAATAHVGNDLSTLPDFPAEIRAPAGTPGGVSAFQIHFASRDIFTPGDHPNTLVAMNPAALKTHLGALEAGGTLIVNEDAFTANNLRKAGYGEVNPLEDGSVEDYQVLQVPMTTLTTRATEDVEGLKPAEAQRTKNLFALGLISWMYGRPTEDTITWLEAKFAKKPAILAGNIAAFKAGYNFADTIEISITPTEVEPAPLDSGEYRNVNGANALAMGLVAASVRSGLQLYYAGYPITPASELLHQLARHDRFGVRTVQAEDEIAAANMALGASFGGQLGVTATSGPGMDLKAETIALAQMVELPLVIIDVQRSGPSTGLPTKTEQSDLMMAIHGRHGESPLPVLAASTPSDCFNSALEAASIAIRYRTPVILLADTFLINSSEPWRLPRAAELPEIDPEITTKPNAGDEFLPYVRNERGARPWAIPGTPGLQHRLGGLEKEHGSGKVSYDGENHALMTHLRAEKLEKLSRELPPLEVNADEGAELLIIGWGSTFGVIGAAARRVRNRGLKVATAHLRQLDPFPANTGEVVRAYPKVLVPELNTGQLLSLLRDKYLVDAIGYNKVEGLPILAEELEAAILEQIE